MKGAILILILCTASICTHAQQIDKKLIIGRWDLYSGKTGENSMCRDSMDQLVGQFMRLYPMNSQYDSGSFSTNDDSLNLVKKIKDNMNDVFKSYFKFDEKGNMVTFACPYGDCHADTGQYKWIAKDQITVKKNTGASAGIYTILSLTDTRLTIRIDDQVSGATTELIFISAK